MNTPRTQGLNEIYKWQEAKFFDYVEPPNYSRLLPGAYQYLWAIMGCYNVQPDPVDENTVETAAEDDGAISISAPNDVDWVEPAVGTYMFARGLMRSEALQPHMPDGSGEVQINAWFVGKGTNYVLGLMLSDTQDKTVGTKVGVAPQAFVLWDSSVKKAAICSVAPTYQHFSFADYYRGGTGAYTGQCEEETSGAISNFDDEANKNIMQFQLIVSKLNNTNTYLVKCGVFVNGQLVWQTADGVIVELDHGMVIRPFIALAAKTGVYKIYGMRLLG